MDVDIESVLRLHLQGGLHPRGREGGHRGVAPVDGFVEAAADFGEAGFLRHLLLGVIVAGQPESLVVAGHGKLGALLADEEIVEVWLLRELIAEAYAIVVDAEPDDNRACVLPWGHLRIFPDGPLAEERLPERGRILIIMVTDVAGLPPDGLPSLIESRSLLVDDSEAVHQVMLIFAKGGMLVFGQFESEV